MDRLRVDARILTRHSLLSNINDVSTSATDDEKRLTDIRRPDERRPVFFVEAMNIGLTIDELLQHRHDWPTQQLSGVMNRIGLVMIGRVNGRVVSTKKVEQMPVSTD